MNTTPSLDLPTTPAGHTETQDPRNQVHLPDTQAPARRMTRDEMRAYILSRPDTPATALASELGLKPTQVAGYRAAATLKRQGRRRTPPPWAYPPLPRKLAHQVMANRRRATSLQRQLKTAIARLRMIERFLAHLSARAKR